MSIAEINEMSKPERLHAMELLWDSLLRSEGGIASPDWHKEVLDERSQKMNSPDAKFYTLAQVRERFRR